MPGLVFAIKALVEEMYEENNGTRVVLLGHSYGGIYSWLLLGSPRHVYGVDEAWRRKYVRAFIAIGTPWAGALQAMRLEASGATALVWRCLCPLPLSTAPTSLTQEMTWASAST
jgi:triacylglycerol esterase/lipase EstA (alpha/beta hydrolase family)